jgi:hypothetical protein
MGTQPDLSTNRVYLPDKRVFGLSGSPRKGGNSDVLLKHILKGVKQNGVNVENVRLRDYEYQPCIGCEIVGELAVFGIFEKGKVQAHDKTLNKAIQLGVQLATALQSLRQVS